MTTTTPAAAPARHSYIVLDGISWDYYERTLKELATAGSHVRVTYDRGRMELMSPYPTHERAKKTIGRMIELYALEKGLPCLPLGSMTCRRADLDRGLEPDECYYIHRMPASTEQIDLSVDPPPDLAIEVDITSGSIPRQPIYSALGVPEIWRYDGRRLTVLHRQADGGYQVFKRSLAFPDLSMAQFTRHFTVALTSAPAVQHRAIAAFRDWVRRQS